MFMIEDLKKRAIEEYGAKFEKGSTGYYKPAPNYPGVKSGRSSDRLIFANKELMGEYLSKIGIKIPEDEKYMYLHDFNSKNNDPNNFCAICVDKNEITWGGC